MKITNEKIYKLLVERGEIIKEGRELSKKIDELTKERNKLGLRAQKIQDKTIPQIEKQVADEFTLGEFEQMVGFKPLENGEIEITIADLVEDYKEALRKRLAEKKK